MGRWVNRDPIGYEGSQWNLFEYVAGRPLWAVDPTGEIAPIIIVIAIETGCCAGCGTWLASTAQACWAGPCKNDIDVVKCVRNCVAQAYGQLGWTDRVLLDGECSLCAAAALKRAVQAGTAAWRWCQQHPIECEELINGLIKLPWH
jgi:uncharacterized protein RhaS with RHS repeats